MRSPIEFEEIDIRWATIYLALNLKVHEVVRSDLQQCVPRLVVSPNYKGGKDPTVLTIGVDKKGERAERKKVMAKVIEVMVNVCFENHLYKWGNSFRRQNSGKL